MSSDQGLRRGFKPLLYHEMSGMKEGEEKVVRAHVPAVERVAVAVV